MDKKNCSVEVCAVYVANWNKRQKLKLKFLREVSGNNPREIYEHLSKSFVIDGYTLEKVLAVGA